MADRFAGKSILVTGAASGIGRASAKMFAAEGGKVLAVDWAEEVEETARMITEAGGTARSHRADAGAEDEVRAFVELAASAHGGLDVVFANAGVSGGRDSILEATADFWAEVLRVNLIGPAMAIKYAAPIMAKAGRGAIICTASVAGIRSGAGSSQYSASKAGVMSLVKTAAQQLSGSGVRVNAICPGVIETGMTKPMFDYAKKAGKLEKIGQLNPLRRSAQPEEIGSVALFLASEEASYVNGQAIAVDGGLSSSHPVTKQVYGKVAV